MVVVVVAVVVIERRGRRTKGSFDPNLLTYRCTHTNYAISVLLPYFTPIAHSLTPSTARLESTRPASPQTDVVAKVPEFGPSGIRSAGHHVVPVLHTVVDHIYCARSSALVQAQMRRYVPQDAVLHGHRNIERVCVSSLYIHHHLLILSLCCVVIFCPFFGYSNILSCNYLHTFVPCPALLMLHYFCCCWWWCCCLAGWLAESSDGSKAVVSGLFRCGKGEGAPPAAPPAAQIVVIVVMAEGGKYEEE